jgi:hypothetical protein
MQVRFKPSRQIAIAVAAVTAFAMAADAQMPTIRFEVRPFVGAFIPTGDQRNVLKDAVLAGVQASWHVVPALSVTGAFGWSPSKDRITRGDQTLDIYQYDIGAELRASSWYQTPTWDFTPFAGAGLGGRTYSYRDFNAGSTTDFDGYGALGGDFGIGVLGVRVEGRDYVSRFKPLTGSGDTRTRNDISLLVGLAYRFR